MSMNTIPGMPCINHDQYDIGGIRVERFTTAPKDAAHRPPLICQFSCQANFTRAFREATGQTPAQYRRSVGMVAAEPAAINDNS